MALQIVVCLVLGYIVGSFSTGYIMGLMNHVDIREMGSGNAGTTNAFRTLGKKAGVITLVGDMLKAILVVLLVRFVIYKDIDYVKLLELICGFGCVLGRRQGHSRYCGCIYCDRSLDTSCGTSVVRYPGTYYQVRIGRFTCSTYAVPDMECHKIYRRALLCMDSHSILHVHGHGFHTAQTEYQKAYERYRE